MAGAVGVRGTVLDLLEWGILHLAGGQHILSEAVETATQVSSILLGRFLALLTNLFGFYTEY